MKFIVLFLLCLTACSVQKNAPLGGVVPEEPDFIVPAPSAGGTDFGGGGDLATEPQARHWFSGAPSVPYCIEVSPDFGVAPDKVNSIVIESLARWETYLTQKRLPTSVLSIKPVETNCDAARLVFLFGEWKSELDQPRTRYLHPLAFAHKKGDVGYLWFAAQGVSSPRWNENDSLRTMVLHELGHVYGNAHVPGTIMDADIAKRLADLPTERINEIDYEEQLAICFNCDVHIKRSFLPQAGDDPSLSLQRLLGRAPRGEVLVEFVRTAPLFLYWGIELPSTLLIKDEEGSVVWRRSASEEFFFERNRTPVFFWKQGGVESSVLSGGISLRSDFKRDRSDDSVRIGLDFSPVRLQWFDKGFSMEILPVPAP